MLKLCTFSIGSLCLGLDVTRVQEVLPPQPVTRTPRAPEAITGLLNLRGSIVTALNLHSLLGLRSTSVTSAMNVVVPVGQGAVSFSVDEIREVVQVDEEQLETPPANLPDHLRPYVQHVVELDRDLLLVFDADAALARVAEMTK